MSFNKPNSPDPSQTANQQSQYNLNAATSQNKLNSYNQDSPFGSVNYVADPSSPSGYRIATDLKGASKTAYDTAGDLATNTASMYSKAPDLSTDAIYGQLQGWQQNYVNPIFDRQRNVLESKLRNQGLAPGSQAYDNAFNMQARNEGDINNQFFQTAQPLAYSQAVNTYNLPLNTMKSLYGIAAPGVSSFQSGPTAQIQPPNYMGAVNQDYQNKYQQFGDTMQGAGQLAGGVGKMAAQMLPFLP